MGGLPDRIELVIFDLDGVVYRGEDPVPGAPELIRRLHDAGTRVRFATNNSMWTRREYAARLRAMGIEAAHGEIVTSSSATAAWLAREAPDVRRLLVVGENGVAQELREASYEVTAAADAADGYDGEPLTAAWDAVVAGLDRTFDYGRLAVAVAAVRGGARFVATNADRLYPTPRGFFPGAGSIVAAIAAGADAQPDVIGKPQPGMFAAAAAEAGVPAERALVVGDNPDADVVAARRAGMATVLVLTGVATPEAAKALTGERQPDAVAPGPAELWRLISARLR
jgi:phosphoglycolate/pyridoxal phosphate phosphatase family enzyme